MSVVTDREVAARLRQAVRDTRLFSVPEIAGLVGLSRSRVYELIDEAKR